MAVYIALALEAIGDITASSEVSRLPVDGPVFDSRIQGVYLSTSCFPIGVAKTVSFDRRCLGRWICRSLVSDLVRA